MHFNPIQFPTLALTRKEVVLFLRQERKVGQSRSRLSYDKKIILLKMTFEKKIMSSYSYCSKTIRAINIVSVLVKNRGT